MSNKRVMDMQQKQILRLYDLGYSRRRISRELGIHRKTIKGYIERYKLSGIEITEAVKPETDLVGPLSLGPPVKEPDKRYESFKVFIDGQSSQRSKPGFTIDNLYKDYKALDISSYYSKSHFYRLVRTLWNVEQGSIRLNHIYGEKLYVDYTGKKLSYVDRETGEQISVEVMVTILPASQYIYVEAMRSQKQEDFIHGIMNALEYISGSPKGIVTDNLKSAVTKAGKYQSTINKSLQAMALHYGTTIDPTRTYRPKDKALVEGAVKISYNSIFYEVQKHTYFSLTQLNKAILEQLTKLNARKLSNCDDSRMDRYLEETAHLNPLPQQRYEVKQYRKAKVQKMGYVLCNSYKNYYSVPYRYIGKKVELRYDTRRLEIYYKSQRIAMHTTSQTKGHYVTEPKHLSSNNQAITKWSPSYFSDLAAQHGAHIQTYINELIEKRPYPEQAYKQAQGILALVKLYSAERVDLACELANKHPSRTYRMIKEILSNNQDQKAEHSTDQAEDHTIPNHANVRGIDYYQ
jgi:transposase/DNA-binding CsgD family transcriptional regulator